MSSVYTALSTSHTLESHENNQRFQSIWRALKINIFIYSYIVNITHIFGMPISQLNTYVYSYILFAHAHAMRLGHAIGLTLRSMLVHSHLCLAMNDHKRAHASTNNTVSHHTTGIAQAQAQVRWACVAVPTPLHRHFHAHHALPFYYFIYPFVRKRYEPTSGCMVPFCNQFVNAFHSDSIGNLSNALRWMVKPTNNNNIISISWSMLDWFCSAVCEKFERKRNQSY